MSFVDFPLTPQVFKVSAGWANDKRNVKDILVSRIYWGTSGWDSEKLLVLRDCKLPDE